MNETILHIILCGIGGTIGLTAADIDLAPPLPIRHRSAWTHSPVIPALLWWWTSHSTNDEMYWLVIGFLPAFGLHVVYDMFPRAWKGSAKISLHPLPGRLPALLSFLYLGCSMLVALVALSLMIEDARTALIVACIMIILTGVYSRRETGGWPPPLNKIGLLRKVGDVPPLVMYWATAMVIAMPVVTLDILR